MYFLGQMPQAYHELCLACCGVIRCRACEQASGVDIASQLYWVSLLLEAESGVGSNSRTSFWICSDMPLYV